MLNRLRFLLSRQTSMQLGDFGDDLRSNLAHHGLTLLKESEHFGFTESLTS